MTELVIQKNLLGWFHSFVHRKLIIRAGWPYKRVITYLMYMALNRTRVNLTTKTPNVRDPVPGTMWKRAHRSYNSIRECVWESPCTMWPNLIKHFLLWSSVFPHILEDTLDQDAFGLEIASSSIGSSSVWYSAALHSWCPSHRLLGTIWKMGIGEKNRSIIRMLLDYSNLLTFCRNRGRRVGFDVAILVAQSISLIIQVKMLCLVLLWMDQ